MKKLIFLFISLVTVCLGFSETLELTVNKDTNFIDISNNKLDCVKKGTVLTINSETVELGRYTLDETAENAKFHFLDKSIYIRDISVNNNSECLPRDIIGSTYTMNYYLEGIYNKTNPNNLFKYEPYLEKLWNESYMDEDEYFYDYYSPITLKFFNSFYIEDDDSFIKYHRNPLFIKHIEKTENSFIFDVISLKDKTYPFLPIYENIFIPQKMVSLNFNFDGDYLYIYKDDRLVFELVKTNKDTQEQIRNYYVDQECDLQKITWPRHADGTCDYEANGKSSSVKTVSTSTNVAPNKTMSTNCNLKLRSGEATSTQVLTVMSAGTKLKILELGKAETIDGISSNWVRVEVQKNAKDRDGKEIKAGTVGWCYGGYLE